MTESEEVVYRLCKKVFLSLWTMASPEGKDPSKELCDALVVFGNDVIVISVKDIKYKATDDNTTGWKRWNRAAVAESVKQLYGAKRYLRQIARVKALHSDVTFELPANDNRRYFLVTVSLGAKREIPVELPMDDKEVVHFIDEYSLETLFGELDSVVDFIEYLERKEDFLSLRKKLIVGGEEDLLAYYIWNGRTFPTDKDVLLFGDDLWESIRNRPEYIAKKTADRRSYFWDKIIEEFIGMRDPALNDLFGSIDPSNMDFELALRTLAKENRFSRRMLSDSFLDFLQDKQLSSRATESFSGVYYVFLKKPKDFDRRTRVVELYARCMIIRDRAGRDCVVVGIATEDDISVGHSLDLVYFQRSNWTDADRLAAKRAVEDLKLFVSPRITTDREDEFPTG